MKLKPLMTMALDQDAVLKVTRSVLSEFPSASPGSCPEQRRWESPRRWARSGAAGQCQSPLPERVKVAAAPLPVIVMFALGRTGVWVLVNPVRQV